MSSRGRSGSRRKAKRASADDEEELSVGDAMLLPAQGARVESLIEDSSGTGTDDDDSDVEEVHGTASAADSAIVKVLEARCATLQKEKRSMQMGFAQELKRAHEEVERLQQKAMTEVKELVTRQQRIETNVPVFTQQLEAAKAALSNLKLSDSRYDELRTIDKKQLNLADHVRLRVYEETKQLRNSVEELRVDRDSAIVGASAAQSELRHLQRDHERSSSMLKDVSAELKDRIASSDAVESKLTAKLEEATKRIASIRHKESEFDSLKKRLDAAQSGLKEVEKEMAIVKEEKRFLQEECTSLAATLGDKSHKHDLIVMDKTYLTKEVEVLRERCSRLEIESDSSKEKIAQLKQQRQELYDKMLSSQEDTRVSFENRLQADVARIQASAKADIDRIRIENNEAHEREVTALKDMRDSNAAEIKRLQADLREGRVVYEDLLLTHRESEKNSDVKHAEMITELKMKAFELERARFVADEASSSLKQTKLESEMLKEKVKVLTEQYSKLDSELARKINELEIQVDSQKSQLQHYEMLEREIDEAVVSVGESADPTVVEEGGGDGGQLLQTIGTNLPVSVKRRVKQSIALARKCRQLEEELAKASAERDSAVKEATSREVEATRLKKRLEHMQQPYSFLARSLKEMEVEADSARARADNLEGRLVQAMSEGESLREDLETLLNERSSLTSLQEEMQAEIAAAAAAAAAEAAAGAALAKGKPKLPLATTANRAGRMKRMKQFTLVS